MTLKVTASLDGVMRASRRVTHRIDAQDIENLLCCQMKDDPDADIEALPDLTKAQILKIVDEGLLRNADARHWWWNGLDDDDTEALRKWASNLVRHRFPEFF